MRLYIEVSVPEGTSTTERGLLLENLAVRLLQTQNYEVDQQVRLTGMEVDLLAREKITGEVVYVECKAYRANIAAEIVDKLLGQVWRRKCSAGWLIATHELSKDARGIIEELRSESSERRRILHVYEPAGLIDRLITARLLVSPSTLQLPDRFASGEEAHLLITKLGEYWAFPFTDVSTGIRTSVLSFNARTGEPVYDSNTISFLKNTDTSLADLNWLIYSNKVPVEASEKLKEELQSIVEVPRADKWADYRPARPQDFIGREQLLLDIIQFFEDVRNQSINTRLFAVKGPSGWGKSSTVIKVVDKARNKQNKNKFFVFAVDSRAAASRRFGELALLRAFQQAADAGFIPRLEFTIGGVNNPFSGSGIKKILQYLSSKNKVICIVFDQFEELLYKQEMANVFEDIRLLCDAVSAAQDNIVIGFSWKTDGTITTDHKAYHLWHSLGDHRCEFSLKPFDINEIHAAINKFERELAEPLLPSLRRALKDHCSGYPWLLKKLAIHIYDLIKGGMNQVSIMDRSLNINELFDKELQTLSAAESSCIKYVGENSPAEFFKIVELFGRHVIDSLISKRIVIRSGQRLTLYWDIFRDYVLTGKVPTIPIGYIPKINLATYIAGLKHIMENKTITYAQLAKVLGFGEGSVDNLIRDYVSVGHAESRRMEGVVTVKCTDEAEAFCLMQKFCKSHKVYIMLERNFKEQGFVSQADVKDALICLYNHESYSSKTWNLYALRMLTWFEGVGLLAKLGSVYYFSKSVSTASLSFSNHFKRNRKAKFFWGESTPGNVICALKCLGCESISIQSFEAKYKRAASAARSLGLIIYRDLMVLPAFELNSGVEKALIKVLENTNTIQYAINLLANDPNVKGYDLGQRINDHFILKWAPASIRRNGNSLRRWSMWCIANAGKLAL